MFENFMSRRKKKRNKKNKGGHQYASWDAYAKSVDELSPISDSTFGFASSGYHGGTAVGNVPMTPYKPPKSCKEQHLSGMKVFDGQLYGYPGRTHDDNYKELNIWLAQHNFPEISLSAGIQIPSAVPHLCHPIKDREAPHRPAEFRDMINIAVTFLKDGKSVAVSCMGGHGRTGIVLACIYGLAHPECPDPITAIRGIGCKKWVEEWKQVEFIFQFLNRPIPTSQRKDDYKSSYSDWKGKWTTYQGGFGHDKWHWDAQQQKLIPTIEEKSKSQLKREAIQKGEKINESLKDIDTRNPSGNTSVRH